MKAVKWLDKYLEEAIMVGFLILLSCVMFLQIIMRFCFKTPLTWPEEFCRYCFVYSAFIASAYCIRNDKMLRVDVVMKLLPEKLWNIMDVVSKILAMIFCIIMTTPAYTIMMNAMKINQVSPAMQMPTWWLYSSAPIGFALGAVRGLQSVILTIQKQRREKLAKEKGGAAAV